MGTGATYVWIAVGSAIGGMGRYACSRYAATRFGETFPWGTLIVNVVGSFIIGGFAALTVDGGAIAVTLDVRQFVMVGICGGFTTFSSLSLQTLDLVRNRDYVEAAGNIAMTLALGMLSVFTGHAIGQALGGG